MNVRRVGGLLLAVALALAGCSGSDGSDGKSCTVTNDGSGGAIITCPDGSSTTVTGDPASCTIVSNGDGTKTITCSDGTSVNVGAAVRDFRTLTASDVADMDPTAVVTAVEIGADGKPLVRFKVNDRHGDGIRNFVPAGTATGLQPTTVRFGILKLTGAGAVNGSGNQTWVNYIASTATSTSSYETPITAGAVLTDNGDGSYAFKFSTNVTAGTGVLSYEPTQVHRLVALVSTSGNPYRPMNAVFDFVPATGAILDPNVQEAVDGDACLQCHGPFRAKAGGTGAFHAGARYDVRGCVLCHNDQSRNVTLSATRVDDSAIAVDGTWTGDLAVVNGESVFNLPVFIHKIHMGEELKLKGGTYRAVAKPWEVTYPQDVRNCTKCHRTNGKANNWKQAPSRRACGACHDDVTFTGTVLNARRAHPGGAVSDDVAGTPGTVGCNGCHPAAAIASYHTPAGRPDPDNYYVSTTTGNQSTNAGWVPAVGVLPPGASRITFEIDSVSTTASNNPQVVFRVMKQDPSDTASNFVTFNATTSTEMMDNFTGAPSVYFAFAVPQSGVTNNDDWSAVASAYLKNLWKGTGGTLTGPTTISGSGGWYTATVTSVKIPANARHLVGAVGLSYNLRSTPSLTQIAAAPGSTGTWKYPYNGTTSNVICGPTLGGGVAVLCDADGPLTLAPKMGGLVVAPPTPTKTATGHTARRTIVATAKCNGCHDQLGSAPNFHVGQRNDAGTCAFCHGANKATAGWSVNSSGFIHAIHAAAQRTVPFTWQLSSTLDFTQVTYPAPLNLCTQCHLDPTTGGDATFDFSAYLAGSGASMENILPSTAATGTFDPANATSIRFSPYVAVDNTTNYGTGFSYTASTGAVYDPMFDTTGHRTLVHSPVSATCFSCHTDELAVGHMTQMGGLIYAPLHQFMPGSETCLMCHGKGKIAAIQDVHK